jgi:PST family polysaccharide transporter
MSALALAPAVSAFYHEPRLVSITSVVAIGFVVTSAGVQHGVLLQRQMRFGVSVLIEIISLLISTSVAVAMAVYDYGYWAIVSTTVTLPLATTVGLWIATGWIPGKPRGKVGIRSMVHFGGFMTLNGFVSYLSSNIDKFLLGRAWGAEAIVR